MSGMPRMRWEICLCSPTFRDNTGKNRASRVDGRLQADRQQGFDRVTGPQNGCAFDPANEAPGAPAGTQKRNETNLMTAGVRTVSAC
ncbi:hypothetical protein P3T16_001996 [Paraburkholderia sp. GAS42]